jgi:hypothetical protein
MDQKTSLLPIWLVGFTGHRHLRDPEKVGRLLRKLMDSLRTEVPGELMGYSSVAIGADTLFAEACLSSGIPWIALLPQPEDDFKKDFDESDWQRNSELLRQAAWVQTLPGTRDRNVAYLECGLSTVEEADLMIAVWDRKSSRGTGGTAEVVGHARNLAKPLILIDPDRLEIEREGFSLERFSDREMAYLNHLPDHHDVEPRSAVEPEERVRHFFRKVDAEASRIAPRFRRLVAASVIMNGLAAILVAAAIGFGINSTVLNAIIFVLLGAAMVAIALLKRKHAHHSWIRCRVAAEICRSALVTWRLGDFTAPVWFSHFEGFGRLAKSIRLLQLGDRRNRIAEFVAWRQNYLRVRVDEQIDYFRRRRQRLATALAIFTWSFWTFSVLGISRTI